MTQRFTPTTDWKSAEYMSKKGIGKATLLVSLPKDHFSADDEAKIRKSLRTAMATEPASSHVGWMFRKAAYAVGLPCVATRRRRSSSGSPLGYTYLYSITPDAFSAELSREIYYNLTLADFTACQLGLSAAKAKHVHHPDDPNAAIGKANGIYTSTRIFLLDYMPAVTKALAPITMQPEYQQKAAEVEAILFQGKEINFMIPH